MADEPAQEPQSTPPAAQAAAEPSPKAEAAPAPTPPVEPAKAAEPQVEPAKAAEPAKEPVKEVPLFTLPEDFKAPESMVTKFTEFAKTLPDTKLAQGVADLYVGMAREANSQWQKQIEDTNRANEAACKAAFSSEELAAAETAVGFFTSFNPGFRDFAKRQLNDPLFTLVMRYVGEQMSEDTIGRPSAPSKPVDNRPLRERAAEKLYGKPS